MTDQPEELHCPKCGHVTLGAYALLGHIYTKHYVANKNELKDD